MCPDKTFANGASMHRRPRQGCGRIYSTAVDAALACLENQQLLARPLKQILKKTLPFWSTGSSISWSSWTHVVFKLGFDRHISNQVSQHILSFNPNYIPAEVELIISTLFGQIIAKECLTFKVSVYQHPRAPSLSTRFCLCYFEETLRWI